MDGGGDEMEVEVKVEWPTGVPQASDKDLAELSNTEGVRTHDTNTITNILLNWIRDGFTDRVTGRV